MYHRSVLPRVTHNRLLVLHVVDYLHVNYTDMTNYQLPRALAKNHKTFPRIDMKGPAIGVHGL